MNPRKISVSGLIGYALIAVGFWTAVFAAVPQGSEARARRYYGSLPDEIGFGSRESVLDSTFDDVPAYVGYSGLIGRDPEGLLSAGLLDEVGLGRYCDPGGLPCVTSVSNPTGFQQEKFRNTPLRPEKTLATHFFAPKITNVNHAPETRQLGWRKLVRLRTRHDSVAARNKIDSAIILFNFFVWPEKPFGVESESVNTQVMLTSTALDDRNSIDWLNHGRISQGGKLSLKSLLAGPISSSLAEGHTLNDKLFSLSPKDAGRRPKREPGLHVRSPCRLKGSGLRSRNV